MDLEVLSAEFSVCKVKDYSPVRMDDPFIFTGSTPSERSLVCPTSAVPSDVTDRVDGWRAFRVKGDLDFSLVGILAEISRILAGEGIGIFAVSTFDTDYIFTKKENFGKALSALSAGGYNVLSPEI